MKKIFLSCVLIAASMAAYSQSLTFGPMLGGGFNIASTDLKSADVKPTGSFLGGAFVRVGAKKIYLQPEIYYVNKTANFSTKEIISGGEEEVENSIKTGNVNVNALLGFKLINLKVVNLRLFAGPSVSFLTAKTVVTEIDGTDYKQSASNIANTSFNLHAGLGLDISKLAIDVRYERGLSDMSKASGSKIAFNNLMLTLGFKIL